MLRKSRFYIHLFVFVIWIVASGLPPAAGFAAPTGPQNNQLASPVPAGDLRGFHLVSPETGWLWLGSDLYWTADGGGSWQKISPSGSDQASIETVSFLDARSGWVILAETDSMGFPAFQLARTSDGGSTWQVDPLALFDPGDVSGLAGAVYLDFIDPATGWLMAKQATSSAFSFGVLFKTTDGGQTWTRMGSTIGDPVYFVTDQVGWVAGGVAGNELYRTQDGGLTWFPQAVTLEAGSLTRYQLPSFKNRLEGILPAETTGLMGTQVEVFSTQDGGETWTPVAAEPDGGSSQPDSKPLVSLLNGSAWTMVDPGNQTVIQSDQGVQITAPMTTGAFQNLISGLDMASSSTGWASYTSGDCQPVAGSMDASQPYLECSSQAGLLRTTDGGQSWEAVSLPQTGNSLASTGTSVLMTGQGFDSCDIPTPSDMQAWFDHSPYRFWNLYIGGSALAACGKLSTEYIYLISQQGWKFNPTWVGPQAECFPYGTAKMDKNPDIAYNQGVAEANAAALRAGNLQLTMPGQPAPIIYYDLEAYTVSDSTCRTSAKSFIAGWTAGLHARGYQAGVYGSGYSSALSDFVTNPQVPDAIWAAAWYKKAEFRSDASVWGISYISDSLWTNHQRLHQYAGGHNETWGGVTFDVDCTVADGPGIDLGGGPQAHVISPLDNAWLPYKPVTVTVAGVDSSVQIDHVDFEWHDGDWQNGVWSDPVPGIKGANGWSATFDVTHLPNQRGRAYFAWVYGPDGKHSGVGVWNLSIDWGIPSVIKLYTSSVYNNPSFRDFDLQWVGTSPVVPIVSYDIQYHDGITSTWQDLLMNTPSTQIHLIGDYGTTYYFRARARDRNGNLGSYVTNNASFSVQAICSVPPDAYEPDNTFATANPILTDGTPQHHNFDVEGDQDWVKFDATAYTPYTIETSNTGDFYGAYADTVLYIYSPDGTTQLASNDDFPGISPASRIDWESTKAGTYYVMVRHYDSYAVGCTTEYDLSVTKTNHWKIYLSVIRK